ncbi:LytR C-terminal domain-containing protein [bacterium]|nr:LytR C-terminal domain-containing protein [bacterium]
MRWRPFLVGAVFVTAAFVWKGPVQRARMPELPDGKPIRIEVLNGSGVAKAGLGLAEELREAGFDVVSIGNADRADYEETLVLDRVGEPRYAEAVAGELGVEPAFRQKNEELLLEVTVILGRDRAARYARDPAGRSH